MNAFGRYEIVRRIGVGGMGEVFYAWAYGVARTRKPVVVKVLRSEMLSEPGAPEMFVEEGRLSLHLSHQNILQVFDFGKADDRYFMAMEYVDGFHLGELKKKAGGRLAPDLAAFVSMEVCLALDYAHRLKDENGKPLQIVHRDVTPSNVLISREGEVKLADFGIARAVGRSQHTQAGQIRGKVRYMSPEAARGEPLDHRADLFSLGAILFELLTGRRAFDAKGGREAILKQIVHGRAPAPSQAGVADVHPALDAVVLRAMAPKREERFPDAFAMHRAIEEACREAGIHPSRGAFLEFLRGLEAAAAAEEASNWAVAGNAPAKFSPPAVALVTPSAPPPSTQAPQMNATSTPGATPTGPGIPSGVPVGSIPAGEGTAAVAPPPVRTVGGVVPPAPPRTNGSKPSSTSGTVPPVIDGPQSTVAPTGVASQQVLFTLVMGERTPAASDELPVFEITREGMKIDLDSLPREKSRSASFEDPEMPSMPSASRSSRSEPTAARGGSNATDISGKGKAPATSPSNEKTVAPMAMPRSEVSATKKPQKSVVSVQVEPSGGEARAVASPDAPTDDRRPVVAVAPGDRPVEERTTDRQADREAAEAREQQERATERPLTVRERSGVSERSVSAKNDARTVPRIPSPSRVPARIDDAPIEADPRSVSSAETIVRSAPMPEGASPSYRPTPPPDADSRVSEVSVVGEPHWKVRRRDPAPVEAEPPLFDRSSRPRPEPGSGPSIPVIALALVLIVALGALVVHFAFGGPGTPTTVVVATSRPVSTPTRVADLSPTAPPATPVATVTATTIATRATPIPTETKIAFVATPTPRIVRTPPPTPKTIQTPAVPGILVLNTQPWTEFTLAGRSFRTPVNNEKIPPGHYTVTLHNKFNPKLDRTVEIDVRSGETTRLILDLNHP